MACTKFFSKSFYGLASLPHQAFGCRRLKTSRQITPILGCSAGGESTRRRGFETTERKIHGWFFDHGSRQIETAGVSALCFNFQRWSAWEIKTHDFGCFVERLPHRIVNGGCPALECRRAFDDQNLAMSPANQQQKIGKRRVIGQTARQCVPG